MAAVSNHSSALQGVERQVAGRLSRLEAEAWLVSGTLTLDVHGMGAVVLAQGSWTLLSAFGHRDEKDDDYDPLETLAAKSDDLGMADPARQYEQGEIVHNIELALARLPARQREAFLLRYWEELDVAEAAAAMGCSEGSVKTHCSRAVHALAEMLKAKGITL